MNLFIHNKTNMGIFTKNDKEQLEKIQQLNEVKKIDGQKCQNEINEILKKYNCRLVVGQNIVVQSI